MSGVGFGVRFSSSDFARSTMLFRQLPHPKTQERRDHGERRADPKWNRLSADNYLGLVEETEKMAESKEREKQRCDS